MTSLHTKNIDTLRRHIMAVAILLLMPASAAVEGGPTRFRAKAVNVLSVVIPIAEGDTVFDSKLQTTIDGETFHSLSVGKPRPWNLFQSIEHSASQARISVVLVGHLQHSDGHFFPEEAGQHRFRWKIQLDHESNEPLFVDDTITFLAPAAADLEFLRRLADPAMTKLFFGSDFFDRQGDEAREKLLGSKGSDIRALKIIFEILEATRDRWVRNIVERAGARGEVREGADMLWKLARELPDSSYAPYASYYAACCFTGNALARIEETLARGRAPDQPRDKVAEHKLQFTAVQEDQDCAKAVESFEFAITQGDDYLKPRAYYQLAMIRVAAGEIADAEQLLRQAESVVPGTGTIEEWCERCRQGIAKLKRRLAKTDAEHGSDRPDTP